MFLFDVGVNIGKPHKDNVFEQQFLILNSS